MDYSCLLPVRLEVIMPCIQYRIFCNPLYFKPMDIYYFSFFLFVPTQCDLSDYCRINCFKKT